MLREMLIIRQPNATNFPVTPGQGERLFSLWGKTGSDWSRDEVIAALRLYEQLRDQSISRAVGSPVERLAQVIGRAPAGVYNKLMNFRALDPRVAQKGLSAGSKMDAAVWDDYFNRDSQTIDLRRLEADYSRLWGSTTIEQSAGAAASSLDAEVERLSKKPLDELMSAYQRQQRERKVARRRATTVVYDRRPIVVTITRSRAGFRCEAPECTSTAFIGNDGKPFTEVHHLVRLADGGPDTIDNTVCVCPNHHRELHHGADRGRLTETLVQLRTASGRPANQ